MTRAERESFETLGRKMAQLRALLEDMTRMVASGCCCDGSDARATDEARRLVNEAWTALGVERVMR